MEYSITDYIAAMGRLLGYSSNKRFLVKEVNFKKDNIGSIAFEINNEIFSKEGLDVFNLTNAAMLDKYEMILSNKISNFAYDEIMSIDEMGEEDKLRSKAVEVSNEYLHNFKIAFSDRISQIKKDLGFTDSDIMHAVKNPLKVITIDTNKDYIKLFLLTAKVKIKNRERLLMIVLDGAHKTRDQGYSPKLKTQEHQFSISKNRIDPTMRSSKENEIEIAHVINFTFAKWANYSHNPLGLFIKGLDYFGVDIIFNQKRSRYYHEVEDTEKRTKYNQDVFLAEYPKFNRIVMTASMTELNDRFFYYNVFGFNYTKVIEDYKAFKI